MTFKRNKFDTYSRDQLLKQLEILQLKNELLEQRLAAAQKDKELFNKAAQLDQQDTLASYSKRIQEAQLGRWKGTNYKGTTIEVENFHKKGGATFDERERDYEAREYEIGPFDYFTTITTRRAANGIAEKYPDFADLVGLEGLQEDVYGYYSQFHTEELYDNLIIKVDDERYVALLNALNYMGKISNELHTKLANQVHSSSNSTAFGV